MSILVWPDVGSRLLIHLGRWRAPSARKPPFHQGVRRSQLSRPRWDSRCRAPASPSRKSLPTPGRRAFLKPQGGKVGSWAVDSHSAMFSKPSRATTIPLFMRPSRSGIQEPCVRDLYHLSMRVSSPCLASAQPMWETHAGTRRWHRMQGRKAKSRFWYQASHFDKCL